MIRLAKTTDADDNVAVPQTLLLKFAGRQLGSKVYAQSLATWSAAKLFVSTVELSTQLSNYNTITNINSPG